MLKSNLKHCEWTTFSSLKCSKFCFAPSSRALSFFHVIISRFMWQKQKSSPPEVFLGKVILKICSKFTGEHPCRSDFNRSNFIEITFRDGCSPVNLLHIFRTPFPRDTSGWLLLIYVVSSEKDGWGTGKKKQIKFSPYSGTKALILRIY